MMPDRLMKLVLVGDTEVGKSCLGAVLAEMQRGEVYVPTIGVEIMRCRYQSAQGLRYFMQVWDTSGDIRFKALVTSFIRGAFAIVYVFDKSSRASLDSIPLWFAQTRPAQGQVAILYGNRGRARTAVAYEEAVKVASALGMIYCEESALSSKSRELILSLVACVSENRWY